MTELPALFQTIKSTVLTIDTELNKTNETGIFFAPELYTAFCIGRDIYHDRLNIFGTQDIQWLREINLGNGGPSDISFKVGNTHIVVELKLRDTGIAYQADIEKLKRLPATDEKFFCVLVDTIENKYDGRLDNLKSQYENEIFNVGHHSFPTWNNWYSSKVHCHLNLYKVL
jgi:hypothetical protein